MSRVREKRDITSSVTITCRRQGYPSWIAQVEGYGQDDGLAPVIRHDPATAVGVMVGKVQRHIQHHHPGLTEAMARLSEQPTDFKLTGMDEIQYTWNLGGERG